MAIDTISEAKVDLNIDENVAPHVAKIAGITERLLGETEKASLKTNINRVFELAEAAARGRREVTEVLYKNKDGKLVLKVKPEDEAKKPREIVLDGIDMVTCLFEVLERRYPNNPGVMGGTALDGVSKKERVSGDFFRGVYRLVTDRRNGNMWYCWDIDKSNGQYKTVGKIEGKQEDGKWKERWYVGPTANRRWWGKFISKNTD